jgi:hypothetical protein
MDRDGTISEEVGYVNHVARYRAARNADEDLGRPPEALVAAVVASSEA